MLTDAELSQARAMQNALMCDEGTITGPGAWKFNPATRRMEKTGGAVVYDGPMLVQSREAGPTAPLVGDDREPTQDFVIKVPWDVLGLEEGMECVARSSRDPSLERQVIVLGAVNYSSWATCRRIIGTTAGDVTPSAPPAPAAPVGGGGG